LYGWEHVVIPTVADVFTDSRVKDVTRLEALHLLVDLSYANYQKSIKRRKESDEKEKNTNDGSQKKKEPMGKGGGGGE
jgi:hypothetical protein